MKHLILFVLILVALCGRSQSYLPEMDDHRFAVAPAVSLNAWAFDLKDVRLTGRSLFKHAMDIDGGYILSLKPGRLLSRFYKNAGLPCTDSAYGGWESEGLSGHTLGHYLSAAAMMYAASGDARFRERVDRIVSQLANCQSARKTGYVGAIPNEDSIFGYLMAGQIKSGGFDLNGGWSPWYTVHKVMAGLVDAYLYCGNRQALSVATKMADWTGKVTGGLNPEQMQKMLRCEFGGMNDVLANIYSITGDKKYLALSYRFYDDFVMKPTSQRKDVLGGKHSNTNIPKAIGSARQYELTGTDADSSLAGFFWTTMVQHHSYVTGGNGNYEYLGEPDRLNAALSDNTAESCCAYNMLKLTGHLFTWHPDSRLIDYFERTLYNDILASQHPRTAMMLYFEPLRMGSRKEFSDSTGTFTCCVGSGMENHAKYTEDIYFEGKDGSLYVNLFIPSRLKWRRRKMSVTQFTSFPDSPVTSLQIATATPQVFALRVRNPGWSKNPGRITVNGIFAAALVDKEGYLVVWRKWKNNDRVTVSFDMSLRAESMPDNLNRIALLYGPVVLAGELGDTLPDPVYGTPVLLTGNHNVVDWITRDKNDPLLFHTSAVGKPFDVALSPFFRNTDNYYSVYWDFFTPDEWKERQFAYEAEKKREQEVDAQTIDIIRLGQMQPERDHNLKSSDESYAGDAFGRTGREVRKKGFFSFDMKVEPGKPASLLCTYLGDDKDRRFDILIDGTRIATETLTGGTTGKFYDKVYPIPVSLMLNKASIEVTISASYDRTAGRVFGCRTIRP